MNNLLIKEPPLMILPGLAAAIGMNEAIVLQQVHFLLLNSNNGASVSGSRHIYNTYETWQKHFPFWSVPTIKRIFQSLERKRLILSIQPDRYRCSRRKYYRINTAEVQNLSRQVAKQFNREKNRSNRSVRRDQFDPLASDQVDPLNIQREQRAETKPPTPGPSSGGFSSLPGTKLDGPVISQTAPGTLRPVAHDCAQGEHVSLATVRRGARPWAAEATAHPAGQEFFALTGLTSFPTEGRQALARAFVNACETSVISLNQLRLIQAVQHRVNVPGKPLELVRSFATVTRDAREAAQQRIQEINDCNTFTRSDTVDCLKAMAAAEAQMGFFTPEDLFGSGMVLPFARWILLAVCIQREVVVEAWISDLKPHVLEEFAVDPGAVVFLAQCGLCLASFAITDAELQETRTRLRFSREQERDNLIGLLN